MPTGDSENSELDDAPMSLVDFEQSDYDLQEMQAAAADPTRVKCVTELDASHTVSLRHELNGEDKEQFKRFVDEMLRKLAQPYTPPRMETQCGSEHMKGRSKTLLAPSAKPIVLT